MSGRAAQLRAIQRRLLLRFRDKNAIPLTQLETLLDGSIEQIIDGLNFMEQNELVRTRRVAGPGRVLNSKSLFSGTGHGEERVPSERGDQTSPGALSDSRGPKRGGVVSPEQCPLPLRLGLC